MNILQELTKEEFERQKSDAARRIRDMYKGQNMPPYPNFITLPENKEIAQKTEEPPKRTNYSSITPASNNIFRFFNFSEIMKSPDSLLILGIIFLLLSDNADEKLILALIFIML